MQKNSEKEKRRNMSEMLKKILSDVIKIAYKRVYSNKGVGSIDDITMIMVIIWKLWKTAKKKELLLLKLGV